MIDETSPPHTDPDHERRAIAAAVELHAASIHLLRRVRREDAGLGISAARLSALSVVGFGGPHMLGDLAAAEQVTAPTMSRIVDALERDGLVERGAGAGDGRVVRVSVTPKGMRVLEEGRGRRTGLLAAALRTLAPDDLDLLRTAARLLEQALRDMP